MNDATVPSIRAVSGADDQYFRPDFSVYRSAAPVPRTLQRRDHVTIQPGCRPPVHEPEFAVVGGGQRWPVVTRLWSKNPICSIGWAGFGSSVRTLRSLRRAPQKVASRPIDGNVMGPMESGSHGRVVQSSDVTSASPGQVFSTRQSSRQNAITGSLVSAGSRDNSASCVARSRAGRPGCRSAGTARRLVRRRGARPGSRRRCRQG